MIHNAEISHNAARIGASLSVLIALLVSLFMANPAVADEDDHDEMEEIEQILVQATRSRRRVQDQPTRIEVLDQ